MGGGEAAAPDSEWQNEAFPASRSVRPAPPLIRVRRRFSRLELFPDHTKAGAPAAGIADHGLVSWCLTTR